ncbi:MAG: glycosyltransferase [Microscillaceae bacterium]|nr:glycosyltransferase [Microscillaceae bacterium]
MPKVSVIMPVFNTEKYLSEAIKSILAQTFEDFELLIIDDGSFDHTPTIITQWANIDTRIKTITNSTQKGIAHSRNVGIRTAQGELIALSDADDIALPTRLAQQITAFAQNPNLGVCGTWVDFFSDSSSVLYNLSYPCQNAQIKSRLLFHCPMVNSSLMIRKTKFLELEQWHQEGFKIGSDFEILTRLAQLNNCDFQNLPEVLQKAREYPQRTIRSEANLPYLTKIYHQNLRRLHIFASEDELLLHHQLTRPLSEPNITELQKIEAWLDKIYQANQIYQAYPEPELSEYLCELWLRPIAGKWHLEADFYDFFKKSMFSPYKKYTQWQKLKVWFKYRFRS